MLLVREVFHCKPAKVKPLVKMFLEMSKLQESAGFGKMRILTDMCGPNYWTMNAEFEVASLKALEDMMSGQGMSEEMGKEFESVMKGYHDLVERGHREIYKIEV
jgi:hypothetical protein